MANRYEIAKGKKTNEKPIKVSSKKDYPIYSLLNETNGEKVPSPSDYWGPRINIQVEVFLTLEQAQKFNREV
jgi:hypothetical protein